LVLNNINIMHGFAGSYRIENRAACVNDANPRAPTRVRRGAPATSRSVARDQRHDCPLAEFIGIV
jgi:hypothetical protein